MSGLSSQGVVNCHLPRPYQGLHANINFCLWNAQDYAVEYLLLHGSHIISDFFICQLIDFLLSLELLDASYQIMDARPLQECSLHHHYHRTLIPRLRLTNRLYPLIVVPFHLLRLACTH